MTPYDAGVGSGVIGKKPRQGWSDQTFFQHDYNRDDFVQGAAAFAQASQRSTKVLFYDDLLTFLEHGDAEADAPRYDPTSLEGVLEQESEATVTLRFLAGEEYDVPGDLPAHTSVTYADNHLEVSVGDEPVLSLDDVLAHFPDLDR